MEERQTLQIIDEYDNVKEYEIIMAFKLEKNNKYYVIYTDNTFDEDGKLNVYAGNYLREDDTYFENIKTEEEWNIIIDKINELTMYLNK